MKKLLVLAFLALFVAACGSSGGGSNSVTVAFTTPAAPLDNVATTTTIVATLTDAGNTGITEPVDWATVFTVIPNVAGGANVCTDDVVVYSAANKTITCTPATALTISTEYVATMTGLTDANGAAIASATLTFTTSAGPAFTVSTVTDVNTNPIATTGTTGVWPTAFTATFSDTVDATTFNATNVTLTCELPEGNPTDQPTLTIAASPCTGSVCEFAVTDAWKYALLDCTLTFTTGVKSSGGTALSADATYAFTNACAVSDDFNASSTSCWTNVYSGSTPAESSWDALIAAGTETFDTASSAIDFAISTGSTGGAFASKAATASTDGFTIIHSVDSVSGINTGGPVTSARLLTMLTVSPNPNEASTYVGVGVFSFDTTQSCLVVYGVANIPKAMFKANCASGHTYDVKAVVSGSGISNLKGYVSTDGAAYVELTEHIAQSVAVDPSVYTHLMMMNGKFESGGTPSAVAASVASIYTEGVTSEDQY